MFSREPTGERSAPRKEQNMTHHFRTTTITALLLCTAASIASEPIPEIKFETTQITIKGKKFTIEIADTDPKRERGLMHREEMPAGHGMIFVFDKPANYQFWMKNTNIPLDLIFLDASGKVVGICNLKPHDETPVGCGKESLYAIELNAGTAKKIGLKVDHTITLPEKVLKAK